MLTQSERNSRCTRSVTLKPFAIDMLNTVKRGPFTELRPLSPNVPGVGAAYAAGFSHEIEPAGAVGRSDLGFPTRFTYNTQPPPHCELLVLIALMIENGLPLCVIPVIETRQPPTA